MEGDGHIGFKAGGNRPGFNCEIASGSLLFLEDIARVLRERLGIETTIKSRPNSNSRKLLVDGGREPIMRLLDLLYKDGTANLRLERKFQTYLSMKEVAARPPDNASINRDRLKEGHFTSPTGTIYHVRGIRGFAAEMGISTGALHNMLKPRKNRFTSRKYGWTKPTAEQIEAARTSGTLVERTY